MVIGLVPAAAFAADDTPVTAKLDITAQMSGAFLMPPQFGVSVSSDLAESYGYADDVEDGVSALDALVKAHELVFGEAFTADTAADYLAVSGGNVSKQFGVDGDEYFGGFFVNNGFPNDGSTGTVVGTHKLADGDSIQFFFYEDEYWGDSWNWFLDKEGAYSRAFTAQPGEELTLTLKSFFVMEAYRFLTPEEMALSDSAFDETDAQICLVDLSTGALTEIDGAITDEDAAVTLKFDEEGTYTITATGTEDTSFTQLLSLTTVKVEKPAPAEDITITATISNAGEVVVPFKEITVKDLNADQKHDVNEAFIAIHDAFFTGGSDAGYAASASGWITKFWGVESAPLGYYNNGESCMSVTDPVAEGDYLTAFIYKDTVGWSDSFAKFDKTSYTGKDSITAKLSRSYYGADYSLVTEDFKGAAITVYTKDYEAVDASKYTVTDNEDGTYKIAFTEAGDYLIQADNADPFIVPALAAVEITDGSGAVDAVKINITVTNAGDVVVPVEELEVTDVDGDGDVTIYDAIYAAHEKWFEGGASGFAVDAGQYGAYITKLWGVENGGAYGYFLNHAMAMSLMDPVAEGDYLVAYVFKDAAAYSDLYAKITGETDDEGVVTLTLGIDSDFDSVYEPFPGADIVVYDAAFEPLAEDAYTVTDNGDGTYTVELKESGDYIFVAYEADKPIVPAVYKDSVTVPEGQGDDTEPEKNDLEKIFKETGDALSEFSFEAGMEWMALGLARAGREVPGLDDYLKSVEDYINEKANDSEQLANASSTNSRFILALTALAQDATKFADHDLIKGLSDLTYVGKQGLNGYTWALLALDSHEYDEVEGATATREAMVEAILAKQHEDGGWSLTDAYPNSDVDITAMTLQALAPYYSKDANVKAAIDKALEFLSGKQNQYGGFGSVDGASVESCAQVIVALTALGIDPSEDERFVKNDWSVTEALSSYYLGEGKFSHTPGAAYNGLATEQAYYAMASYFRFKDGQTSLYDMTDVEFEEESETLEGPIVKITDKDGSEVKFSYADIEEGVKLTKPVAISVNDELDETDKIDITWQRDIVVPEDTKFPVTVEFAVDEKDQEKTVYIYHYDAEKKAWEVVGSGKGKTVTAKFDSLSPGAMVTRTDEAPNTGDASSMFLWAAMIVAAAAAGTAALLTGRKRKED